MAALEKTRLDYFQGVIAQMEQDKRFEQQGNIIFTILKDVIPDTPIYLDPDDFVELLFDFIRFNNSGIQKIMYSRQYIHDPRLLRTVTGTLIQQVIALSFDKHEDDGETDTSDLNVHKLTWPYRDTDVLDPDEEPDEWLAAIDRSEKWKAEQKVDRRKSGLARIDDKAMALFEEKKQNEEN